MKFNDSRKAVFLPINENVLCQYKGYVLNDEMRPDLSENDVYYIKKEESEYQPGGIIRKTIGAILMIPLLPFIIIGALIDNYNKNEKYLTILQNGIFSLLKLILRKRIEITYNKYKKDHYRDIQEEDIPGFIKHCHANHAKVYLYSYNESSSADKQRVNELIENGAIQGIQLIEKITDLSSLVQAENISIHNSFLVLLLGDLAEVNDAKKLGFNDMLMSRNIELWAKRNFSGDIMLRWNSKETLASMKENIIHYIDAKQNVYLDNKTVIFIEEAKDDFLNNYISKNYERLCTKFQEKGMHFIYFPALRNGLSDLPEGIYPYLKLRIPYLYNLSDNDIKELIDAFIANIDEEAFISYLIASLELPYFKRPCLLRSLSGGWKYTENRFTYKPLIYSSEEDLNALFDSYFLQLAIPNDEAGVRYSREKPPAEYDTDYYFYSEAFKDEPEFKEKIDQLKAQGNYGVLAEAIIYMLATLKNVQPELLQKIQPLIEGRDLEKKSQIFSPIHIDKDYSIFLPFYGNREIKLHALPKTVYVLFLKHPEGIRFKELFMYEDELMEIYLEISPKSDLEIMRKSIADLVDCTNPSLNQKCSRIRQEISSIIDKPLAKYYYIDGNRGEEKKIKIDPSYIQFD
jgi:hypothetical protein